MMLSENLHFISGSRSSVALMTPRDTPPLQTV